MARTTTTPAALVLATVSTGHFDFTTVAASRADAAAALGAAWARHRRDYRDAEPDLMGRMITDGEVTFTEIGLGQVTRDGQVI